MFNPLETPWLLLIIGIVTLVVGSFIRNNFSPKKGLLLILCGLLIMASAFGVDYFFQTDLEQLRNLILTCRRAAVTNNPALIGPCISSQYRDSIHPTKAAFTADAERIIGMAGISRIRFQTMTFQITGDTARADLNISVILDSQRSALATGGLFFVEIGVEFQKENQTRWVITSAEIESVNNEQTNWNIAR